MLQNVELYLTFEGLTDKNCIRKIIIKHFSEKKKKKTTEIHHRRYRYIFAQNDSRPCRGGVSTLNVDDAKKKKYFFFLFPLQTYWRIPKWRPNGIAVVVDKNDFLRVVRAIKEDRFSFFLRLSRRTQYVDDVYVDKTIRVSYTVNIARCSNA